MNKNLISKSNALVESSYRLSLTEARIILYGISLVNPLKHDFPLSYRIDVKRFAEIFNIENKNIYSDLKQIILGKFWERDFSYINEKRETVVLRWLTKVVYEDKRGYLEIKFHEDLQPFLHQLKGNFTSYYMEQTTKFKSIYSIRVYELCIMRLNKHIAINHKKQKKSNSMQFEIRIEELKKRFELENKYDRFCDFKTRVLEVAKKEINKHSDIKIDYEIQRKNGRSPSDIIFHVKKKIPKNEINNENQNNIIEISQND